MKVQVFLNEPKYGSKSLIILPKTLRRRRKIWKNARNARCGAAAMPL
jgi:hypothetical protein